jgi:glycosyltransferase involved in cell wall biosynthesis
MWAVAGGSERRTYELYRLLSPHADVKVWTTHRPHPSLAALLPIQRIVPGRLQFPRGGTVVFVGVYYRYGRWIHWSGCRRRIIVYNSHHPHILRRRVRKLRSFWTHDVEVVFAARWVREESGFDGPVQVSPVDMARFTPRSGPRPLRPFTVGRLSRNQPEKHDGRDPALYAELVGRGMSVRLMGADCLRQVTPFDQRIELLPECAVDAADFLQGLDCLFYRTAAEWREPHGRVVQEAMACGLPVVCCRHGGMSEYIDHGRNGFLVDDDRQALQILEMLRADPALRERVGAAARRSMEALFSAESMQRVRDYYLVGREAAAEPPGVSSLELPEPRLARRSGS